MRNFFLAAIVVSAAASTVMMPVPAQARDYPFCIKGEGYEMPTGVCSFDTYQQCLATASGLRAYCDANPFFVYPTRPRVAYAKRPRRHY